MSPSARAFFTILLAPSPFQMSRTSNNPYCVLLVTALLLLRAADSYIPSRTFASLFRRRMAAYLQLANSETVSDCTVRKIRMLNSCVSTDHTTHHATPLPTGDAHAVSIDCKDAFPSAIGGAPASLYGYTRSCSSAPWSLHIAGRKRTQADPDARIRNRAQL
jgi:hypothetical protein